VRSDPRKSFGECRYHSHVVEDGHASTQRGSRTGGFGAEVSKDQGLWDTWHVRLDWKVC